MSEITLSKAVRSNLLNLQSTADLLGKSQERLSTGLRVNSALDNPTNFFTAQGLNSRANDLSQLLDSVSNAVQTVAAADKGITAITKLVESAQATARQALQTSATIGATSAINAVVSSGNTTSTTITASSSANAGTFAAGAFTTVNLAAGSAAQAGTLSGGAFTSLNVSGTGSAAQAGTLAGGAFTSVDVSGTGSLATSANVTGSGFAALDVSAGSVSFSLNVDGAGATAVTIDSAAVSAYNLANTTTLDENALTAQDVADLINDQFGSNVVTVNGGELSIDSSSFGTGSTVAITGYTSTANGGATGLADSSDTGADAVTADAISFSVNVNGAGAQAITIDDAAVDAYNLANTTTLNSASLSAQDIADIINDQFGSNIASVNGGAIDLTSTTQGGSSTIAVTGYTANVSGGSTGISDGSDTGSALVAADSVSFSVNVDGAGAQAITIDDAAVDAYNLANTTTLNSASLSAQDVADIINDQFGSNIASVNGGAIDLTSTTQGGSSTIAVTGYTASATSGSTGISDGSDTGSALVAASSISFGLNVDGAGATTITIDAAAVTTYNTANSTSLNAASLSANDIRDLINDQAGANIASVVSGALNFTSTTQGASSSVAITGYSASVAGGSTGIANNSDTGAAAVTGTAGSFTINGQTVTLAGGDDASDILTAIQTAAAGSGSGSNAFTVSNSSGVLTLTGTAGNDVVIAGLTAGQTTALGLSNGTTDGTPAGSSGPNPKRAELVETYNDLLGQIDALAKDSGFNGVNLLNGDDLSVLFNEDGSSSLDIDGITDSSTGLGLAALASTGFDTNSSINSTLDDLKDAIETLRGQSAKFGSNLSVVETRQDFTKNMINVLQTGASNLTLADTNEEAANVLALQTRQQLSSTALSLASQAGQNVLRLF